MRAVVYEEFGGADVLRVVDRPEPHIGADTVVVRVAAAALNPVDAYLRAGGLQGLMDTHFPAVPGWDVAGTVVKVGLDTPEFQVGDEIIAYARKDVVQDGTLAEYVAVPVRTAAKKPAGLPFDQAAGLPLAGLTALQSIRRSGLAEGDTVLVHAAAGGVGSIAVQLAVHAGARVVGTASERNHDYLRALGAEPVAYGDGLLDAARALAPEGFDVVLDYVGGQAIETAPALLRAGGTIASITDARARDELGGQYVWVRPDTADLAHLADLAARGVIRVEVSQTFPLDQAADAYRALETGHTRGKIVVTP
ncbi:NADP-dependent oxidoreductase [Cellulomonas pakistanensis]|uniref:NADP-dependent oxidoreductase n=1 Tax=Cellulomonas pakistanensis TaxID=992287 RepID=UPI001942ABCA|nr:NADP-dependent oxidoreductase [Cellulomonas pakistanensis]